MSNNEETLVLVADDEPSTLALVTAHVRSKKGFKVVEASDGDMAWQLAHEHLPDLVILDVMMPGMSGWEVCRKIRESLPLAHTGVIMLTGIGENLNEMTSPLYGADAHVDKPFEFADLDEKIETTLKSRRDGAFGRADHADEEEGDVPEVGPAVTQPSPPLSADGGKPKKAREKKAKVVEADDDDAPESGEVPSKPAKVAKKKAAKKAPDAQLALLAEPSASGPEVAKAKKAPAPPAKAEKKAPAKAAKAAKKAAKKAPAKAAKKAAKKAPAKAAKKAPAKAAKKAAKKAPAKAAKKAPAKAAKKAAKKKAKRK